MASRVFSGGRNLVITGFMGTGKTSVAKKVTERLGMLFADMDQVIEERTGVSISELFASPGEAFFREEERKLCQELASPASLVIATGGGALISFPNREAFLREGNVVICLDCEPGEIIRRLEKVEDRPLLEGDHRRERVESLLAQRRAAYAQIPLHIDTTALMVEEVADQVISLYERGTGWGEGAIEVKTPTFTYEIVLQNGALEQAGELLSQREIGPKVAIVTDRTVGRLYAPSLEKSLAKAGLFPSTIEMSDGEAFKTLETVRTLYDRFIELDLDRASAIVALGGGVVGDVVGFAATTYMRGLPLVQVPTTLLAMVDSSVGGKVAVDHPRGKNLIGAFKQPELVIADPAVLATLPEEELLCGLAEVVKHGVIGSPALFHHLETRGTEELDWMLWEAVKVKVGVVEEDPFEKGRRAILNLGHTFGHALEALSDFRLPHGQAVSVGLGVAAGVSFRLGLCQERFYSRLLDLLRKLGLPTAYRDFEPERIWQAMAVDKKKRGGKLRFVLPKRIGEMVLTDEVPEEVVLEELAKARE